MKYSDLKNSLIAYYEGKLEKGALMAVDDLFNVKTANEKEMLHIYKAHLILEYIKYQNR